MHQVQPNARDAVSSSSASYLLKYSIALLKSPVCNKAIPAE